MPCDQHYDCKRCNSEVNDLADRLNAVKVSALALLRKLVTIAGTKAYAKIAPEAQALLRAVEGKRGGVS